LIDLKNVKCSDRRIMVKAERLRLENQSRALSPLFQERFYSNK